MEFVFLSPQLPVFLSKCENHRESLVDLTLQNRSSVQVSREDHNYNSIFSIAYSPWEKTADVFNLGPF